MLTGSWGDVVACSDPAKTDSHSELASMTPFDKMRPAHSRLMTQYVRQSTGHAALFPGSHCYVSLSDGRLQLSLQHSLLGIQ